MPGPVLTMPLPAAELVARDSLATFSLKHHECMNATSCRVFFLSFARLSLRVDIMHVATRIALHGEATAMTTTATTKNVNVYTRE